MNAPRYATTGTRKMITAVIPAPVQKDPFQPVQRVRKKAPVTPAIHAHVDPTEPGRARLMYAHPNASLAKQRFPTTAVTHAVATTMAFGSVEKSLVKAVIQVKSNSLLMIAVHAMTTASGSALQARAHRPAKRAMLRKRAMDVTPAPAT
jgi:hypothetical protein